MRTPSERLAEINKRADARIAAIQKRNRTIAGACTTLAMCLMIGLGAYRMLAVPDTPPLVPPEQTTGSNVTTVTQPTDTTVSVVVPTSTAASATSTAPLTTDGTVYVTVTTTEAVASATTATTPSTRATSHSITTDGLSATVTSHTTVSSQTVTTTSTHATTATTASDGDGNIQAPPFDDPTTTTCNAATTTTDLPCDESTTTTGDWNFDGGGTNPPPTTTTTAVPSGNIVFSVSSFEDVSVGDEITVDVTVSDYHYIVSGELYIQYDPDALQLQSEIFGATDGILNGAYALSIRCPAEGDMELRFSTSATVGSDQGGTILRLHFKVRDGFRYGTKIICEVPQMVSDDGHGPYDTPVTVINGTITPADDNGYDWWT